MNVGAVRESFPGEKRVALTPPEAENLTENDVEVFLESGAGREAGFADEEYESSGATFSSRFEVWPRIPSTMKKN